MRKLIDKYQNGSAMIIAILMATLISTMILGASRLVINEIQINSRYSDELVANYAAEAGIERGLYEYKNNPFSLQQSQGATKDNPYLPFGGDAIRLPGDTVGPIAPGMFFPKPTYKVKMWSLAPNPQYSIDKDETKEIQITGDMLGEKLVWTYNANDLTIEKESPTCPRWVCVYLDVVQYSADTALGNQPLTQDIVGQNKPYVDGHTCGGGWENAGETQIDATGGKILRIRPYVLYDKIPSQYNLRLENNYSWRNGIGNYSSAFPLSPPPECKYSLKFGASIQNYPNTPIDQGDISIRSEGAYGKVKKVLEAHVSNKSNKAIEIFDYVIYAGDKLDIK